MLNASQKVFAKKVVNSFDLEGLAKECKLNVRIVTDQLADPDSELYLEVQTHLTRKQIMNDFFTGDVLLNELIQMFISDQTVAKDKIQCANIIIKLMNPDSDAADKINKVLDALIN